MLFNYSNYIRITATIVLSILIQRNSLAVPGWQWAKTAGGISEERSRNTAFDNSGNSYSIGSFSGNSISFDANNLPNNGLEDIYLVKYDPAGNVLWAQSYGTMDTEVGYSICCDQNGNIYITGYFDGSTITFGNFTLNGAGNDDIFLVKLDANGTVLWASSYGGNGDDYGNNLTTDINENVYLVGNFNSPSITIGSDNLVAVGTAKAFVAKFDSNGNPSWAAGSRGPSYDAGKCVTTDNNGNTYMAGEYYDYTVWFDTDSLMNSGQDDIFVVKYDMNGNEVWVKTFGSFDPEKVTGLVAIDNGDIFLSGHFYSPYILFDNITLNNADFPAWDMFITKLDVNSNVVWAKSAIGNTDNDEITGMVKATNGNLIVSGWYQSSISLGSTTLTSTGMSDIFIAELDTAGIFQWALSAGGTEQDYSYSVSVDQNGDLLIGGFFESSTMQFGGISITDLNAGWDMFVTRLSNQTGINSLSANMFTVYPNPVHGDFTITSSDGGKFSVEIINSMGQTVYFSECTNPIQSVSCSELSNGIYFLRLDTGVSTVLKRLIIGD